MWRMLRRLWYMALLYLSVSALYILPSYSATLCGLHCCFFSFTCHSLSPFIPCKYILNCVVQYFNVIYFYFVWYMALCKFTWLSLQSKVCIVNLFESNGTVVCWCVWATTVDDCHRTSFERKWKIITFAKREEIDLDKSFRWILYTFRIRTGHQLWSYSTELFWFA